MNDYDDLITQCLRRHRASQAFRDDLAERSGQALARHHGRRVWGRRLLAGVMTLILCLAGYQMGRITAKPATPSETDLSQHVGGASDYVEVPMDLVTWLEAGRFFRQLGMEERATTAFDQAGKLASSGHLKGSYSETDHRKATLASLLMRSDHFAKRQQEAQGDDLRPGRKYYAILAHANGELSHDQ